MGSRNTQQCTQRTHARTTYEDFTARTGKQTHWPEAELIIADCLDCGSTLAWPADTAGEPTPYLEQLGDALVLGVGSLGLVLCTLVEAGLV